MKRSAGPSAMLAIALAASTAAPGADNPLEWEVDYDRMLGMWRHETAEGHVVEVLLERDQASEERYVTLCWATQPHGYYLEGARGGAIEEGVTRNDEPYLEIEWQGAHMRLYPERQGKPLHGVMDRPVYRRPRGKGLHCLHRFARGAPPAGDAHPARWRVSDAEPLLGYWAGPVTGGQSTAGAAAVTDIDAEGRASGVVCTHWRTARGYAVSAHPFGAARPSGGSEARVHEGPPRRIEIEARTARDASKEDITWWSVEETGDSDTTWLARSASDGETVTKSTQGALTRIEAPAGCLDTARPMLPAMADPAAGEARKRPVTRRSDGRWRRYTR